MAAEGVRTPEDCVASGRHVAGEPLPSISTPRPSRLTPTTRAFSQDTLYRRFDEIAEFIRESCRVNLKLPQVTIATATVFFQRYFVPNVLPDDRRTKIIAFACVFLAAKVEDCTKHPMKSLESVIRGMHRTDVKIKAGKTSQSLGACPAGMHACRHSQRQARCFIWPFFKGLLWLPQTTNWMRSSCMSCAKTC